MGKSQRPAMHSVEATPEALRFIDERRLKPALDEALHIVREEMGAANTFTLEVLPDWPKLCIGFDDSATTEQCERCMARWEEALSKEECDLLDIM